MLWTAPRHGHVKLGNRCQDPPSGFYLSRPSLGDRSRKGSARRKNISTQQHARPRCPQPPLYARTTVHPLPSAHTPLLSYDSSDSGKAPVLFKYSISAHPGKDTSAHPASSPSSVHPPTLSSLPHSVPHSVPHPGPRYKSTAFCAQQNI